MKARRLDLQPFWESGLDSPREPGSPDAAGNLALC